MRVRGGIETGTLDNYMGTVVWADAGTTNRTISLPYTGRADVNVVGAADRLYLGLSTASLDPWAGGNVTVSGSGGINKTGVGTLFLRGSNTFSGGLTISSGTVSVIAQAALGSTTAANTSAVILNGGTMEYTGAGAETSAANRGFQVGANGGTIRIANSTANLTLSGPLTNVDPNTPTSLTKTGAGTLTLNNSGNALNGPLTIAEGTISSTVTNLGTINNIVINGGGLNFTSGVNASSGSSRAFQIGSNNGTISVSNANVNVTINGNIDNASGATSATLTKTGPGTLTIAGNNNLSGSFVIAEGTVAISAPARLGTLPGTAVANAVVIDGGTLDYTSSTSGLSGGNRGFQIGPNGGTIRVSNSNGTYEIGGILANQDSNAPTTLFKTGPGTLALTSGGNSFRGSLFINEGTVSVGAPGNLGTSAVLNPDAVILAPGTTLGAGSAIASHPNRGYRISDNSFLRTPTNFRIAGPIQNATGQAGQIRKIGDGTLWLESGTMNITGGTRIESGRVVLVGNNSTSRTLGGTNGLGVTALTGTTFEGHGTVVGNSSFETGSILRFTQFNNPESTSLPTALTDFAGLTFNGNVAFGDITLAYDLGQIGTSHTAGLNSDRMIVNGTLDLGSLRFDNFTFGTQQGGSVGATLVSNTYLLIVADTFTGGLSESARSGFINFSGNDWSASVASTLSIEALDGGKMGLVLTTIPEPSAFAGFAGLGALGFASLRRRRH